MTETLTFTISTPPISTNKLRVNIKRGGRTLQVKNPEYISWISIAGYEVNKQKGFDCTHPFLWSSHIEFPCNITKMDLDNCEKALFDLLNKLEKVPDDRYQCKKSSEWVAGDTFRVHVTREPLDKWLEIKEYSKPLIKKLRLGYPD